MDFTTIKTAVAAQFTKMANGPLFTVDLSKDELWNTYLSAFPEGTNPMYRERTEHDCNCCKQFIRAVGNVVSIVDNKLVTIWDGPVNEPNYQVVATALSDFVKSKAVAGQFLHYEATAGSNKSFEDTLNGIKRWDHFFVNIPRVYVAPKDNIASRVAAHRSSHDVFLRSLNEFSMESVDIVLDLIAQNAIYRGQENRATVNEFKKLKVEFDKLKTNSEKDNFVWANVSKISGAVAHIRSSAIGTLIDDISSGKEIDDAVRSFEAKVAPANYKRPTAVVTKKMIEAARNTISELGLTSALERRFATLTDISINNILFANRQTKNVLMGDVFDDISAAVVGKVSKKKETVEEISIDNFISDILPRVDSVELMVENSHQNNFVSLIAPVDPSAGNLFKWDNKFSWSYAGDMADSIKERVKAAGGNVSGDVCCRLAWFNYDDLDLHMIEPDGYEIYFGNRGRKSRCGGDLDVDMNAGRGSTRTPVENIVYENVSTMKEGNYKLFVYNYNKRESANVGFEVECDFLGSVHKFVYENPVRGSTKVDVVEFNYSKKNGITIVKSLPSTTRTKEVWGINTLTYVPVNAIMLSPNYWDDKGVGNKHYFFMLDGCVNDGSARGFFNEFLKEELNKHRKVFEIVGSKMTTKESKDQLSGLGFSSTQRNSVMLRVKGSFTRVIKVNF